MNRLDDILERLLSEEAAPEERMKLLELLDSEDPASFESKLESKLQSFHTTGQMPEERSKAAWAKIEASIHPVKVKAIPWLRYAVAACIVLLAGIGAYTIVNKERQQEVVIVEQPDIQPAIVGAILKLSDGRIINLDTAADGSVMAGISKDKGTLEVQSSEVEYATLETPRGRIMNLVLPDGSRVWLNAGSSITFPTAFTGATREVRMTGEAYYEVAPLAPKGGQKIPFIVQAGDERVEVLGTHFNIYAYSGEVIKTTLLEGSVKVQTSVIKPGEQYAGGAVNRVDTEPVMAWKNGLFSFKETKLPVVMKELERWYDIDVVFEGAVSSETFSGKIPRDLTLQQLLKGLAGSRIHYKFEDGKLIVLP